MVIPREPVRAPFNARDRQRFRAFLRRMVLVALLGFAAGSASAAQDDLPPMTAFLATLEDEVRELPKQQIAWDTHWKLCWDAVPGAVRYEMQIVTSEGTSERLRELDETCWKIQVATGRNPKKEGFRQRETQLKLQYGQLAVRLRAVLPDGRVTAWSRSFAVAEAGVAAGAPAETAEHKGHRH